MTIAVLPADATGSVSADAPRMAQENETTRRWTQSEGDFSILGGSSLISHCEPHFHETYVIALMRRGDATVNFRDRHTVWRPGEVILCNPYEILSGDSVAGELTYDVCYPSQAFMREISGWSENIGPAIPHLSTDRLSPADIDELSIVLAAFTLSSTENRSCATAEQGLIDFVRARPFMVEYPITGSEIALVTRVHEAIENASEYRIGVAQLAHSLCCDRSHLMRAFRRATGLPPSSYIRQLRLARALEMIREGGALADIAAFFGFSDQAHLTREFKRVYGTTPGKLARDIVH